jgi:hypothetical protein
VTYLRKDAILTRDEKPCARKFLVARHSRARLDSLPTQICTQQTASLDAGASSFLHVVCAEASERKTLKTWLTAHEHMKAYYRFPAVYKTCMTSQALAGWSGMIVPEFAANFRRRAIRVSHRFTLAHFILPYIYF